MENNVTRKVNVLGRRIKQTDPKTGLIKLEPYLFVMDGKVIYFDRKFDIYKCRYKNWLTQDCSFNTLLLYHDIDLDRIEEVCKANGYECINSKDFDPTIRELMDMAHDEIYLPPIEQKDFYCMVVDESENIQSFDDNIHGRVFETQDQYDNFCNIYHKDNLGKLNAVINVETAIANNMYFGYLDYLNKGEKK